MLANLLLVSSTTVERSASTCEHKLACVIMQPFGAQQGLAWRTLTGAQVRESVDRLAAELAAAGVTEGDKVVLWLPNHWRTALYHFALWKLGAVAVPLDRETNPEAGARILASIAPRLVIAGYGERPAWLHNVEALDWWEPGGRSNEQVGDREQGTGNRRPTSGGKDSLSLAGEGRGEGEAQAAQPRPDPSDGPKRT